MQLGVWVADLAQRLAQLESMTKEDRFESFSVTLGLLFAPGAYLTATRQAVAHRTRVSLENLKLELAINSGSVEGGFLLQGELATSDHMERSTSRLLIHPLRSTISRS